MKTRFNGFFDLKYQTNLSVMECFERIISEPHIFKSDLYNRIVYMSAGEKAKERNYDCYPISQTELHLTMKGGQYTKFIRTRYVLEFLSNNDLTTIHVKFQGEFLGLLPTTSTDDIDSFMKEKIQAIRFDS